MLIYLKKMKDFKKKFDGIAILINLLIDKKIEGEDKLESVLSFFLKLSKELEKKKRFK
jgi:predicted transcriptional regulator